MESEIPTETKKGKSKTPQKAKESILKQKSPAEFFAENKNIAGFDNPGKCLYTTGRELVENALDSAESISELPVIEITIEEIIKSKFDSMIGLVDRERIDEALHDDYETAKAREVSAPSNMHSLFVLNFLIEHVESQEIQAKNAALGEKVKEPAVSKGAKGRGEASFYRVTCKDNGRGMPQDVMTSQTCLDEVQLTYDIKFLIGSNLTAFYIVDNSFHLHFNSCLNAHLCSSVWHKVCPGGQISTWIPDAAANAVNKRNNPSAGTSLTPRKEMAKSHASEKKRYDADTLRKLSDHSVTKEIISWI
ncbi:hypothetical protein GQ457_08G002010 [Hibiscus cannabinus]